MHNFVLTIDYYAHNAYNIEVLGKHMKFRELEKMLIHDGWILKNTKGSHHQYVHPTKPGKVTIPFKRGDIPLDTVKSIIRQSGIPE